MSYKPTAKAPAVVEAIPSLSVPNSGGSQTSGDVSNDENDEYVIPRLTPTFAGAPSDGDEIEVRKIESHDGTNFEDSPGQFWFSFFVRGTGTSQDLIAGLQRCPARTFRTEVINRSSQNISSGKFELEFWAGLKE